MSEPFEKTIETFKAAEKAEHAAVLLSNPDLQRAVGAWHAVRISLVSRLSAVPSPDKPFSILWGWLWENVAIHTEDFPILFDLPEGRAEQVFQQAVSSRLVYPDGTIHSYAARFIAGKIIQEATGK